MRSVVIHLAGVTREVVRVRLSQFAEAVAGDNWRFPPGASRPVLYIEFYNDFEREFEPGELQSLKSALGQMPDVIVIANITGRVPADAEVRLFTECLLGTFRGLADDGYSDHYWTLEEIRSGAAPGGHSFFDYVGWYRDRPEAALRKETSNPLTGKPGRSPWFYVALSSYTLFASFVFLPPFFCGDAGQILLHFRLPGVVICVGISAVCVWSFFAIPSRQIMAKLVSGILLAGGLYLGFDGVFTYILDNVWNPFDFQL